MDQFDGVKVFSASRREDRAVLGEAVTNWLGGNKVTIIDKIVLQSSDSEFHCLTIVLFYARGS